MYIIIEDNGIVKVSREKENDKMVEVADNEDLLENPQNYIYENGKIEVKPVDNNLTEQ